MKVYAYCQTCGARFVRDEWDDWKKLCLDCYVKHKREKGGGTTPHWTEDQQSLSAEVDAMRQQLERLHEQLAARDLRIIQLEQGGSPIVIPGPIWKDLAFLCHPDRNQASDRAKRAMQFLNGCKSRR